MTNFAGIPVLGMDSVGKDWGKWLIHGPQGAGKTWLASSIAEFGKTLFIDLIGEHGVRSFKGAPWEKNIDVIRPTSVTQIDDIYWQLEAGNHPYQAVVLDSLTAMQKMATRYLTGASETAVREISKGMPGTQLQTWGQSLDIMTDTATFWYGLADAEKRHPMHVVFTAQTKITADDVTKELSRVPDVQKGALSITMATPEYVIYADVEENLDAVSDPDLPATTHIVRFGSDPAYRIKARLPLQLRDKIPAVLGRKNPVTLGQLSRILGVGGVPAKKTRAKSATAEAKPHTGEEVEAAKKITRDIERGLAES